MDVVETPSLPYAAAMRDRLAKPEPIGLGAFASDQMLRRRTCSSRQQIAVCCIMAFAWNGDWSRSARPARKTSLFGTPGMESGRDEKARSVVALSRVPRLAGFAGSPPAADFYQWLTGLLSGSPLFDTRPQARAIWAARKIGRSADITSVFFEFSNALGCGAAWRRAGRAATARERHF